MSIAQPETRTQDLTDDRQAEPGQALARAYELAAEWSGSRDVTIAAAGRILARTLDGPSAVHDLI